MRFFLGFTLFISLSVGLTVLVNSVTVRQEQEKQTAAAVAAMLEWH